MKKGNNERYYETEVGKLPSVTTVLSILDKPALIVWAVKETLAYIECHLQSILKGDIILTEDLASQILREAKDESSKISEKAMNIGSRVHSLIEEYYKRKIQNGNKFLGVSVDKECEKPFEAFLKWNAQNKVEPLETEQMIWSKKGYAGTLDLVCRLNDKLYLVDFKTSRGFYKEYSLQISAYLKAWKERRNKKGKIGIGILRLDKITGMPEFKDYTKDYRRDILTFLALLKVWQGLKGG